VGAEVENEDEGTSPDFSGQEEAVVFTATGGWLFEEITEDEVTPLLELGGVVVAGAVD
jgi:hypothetical protein